MTLTLTCSIGTIVIKFLESTKINCCWLNSTLSSHLPNSVLYMKVLAFWSKSKCAFEKSSTSRSLISPALVHFLACFWSESDFFRIKIACKKLCRSAACHLYYWLFILWKQVRNSPKSNLQYVQGRFLVLRIVSLFKTIPTALYDVLLAYG